jgi:hypothetical protein
MKKLKGKSWISFGSKRFSYDTVTGEYYGKKTSKISLYNSIYNNQTAVKIGAGIGVLVGLTAILLKK